MLFRMIPFTILKLWNSPAILCSLVYGLETFLLPTDAHNVKKYRVIKTF